MWSDLGTENKPLTADSPYALFIAFNRLGTRLRSQGFLSARWRVALCLFSSTQVFQPGGRIMILGTKTRGSNRFVQFCIKNGFSDVVRKDIARQNRWKRFRKTKFSDTHVNDNRKYYREIYLQSDHWKELRGRKLAANPVCQFCGSKDFVEPHHLIYKNLYDVKLGDLVTLCRRCHSEEHQTLDSMMAASPNDKTDTIRYRRRFQILKLLADIARRQRTQL